MKIRIAAVVLSLFFAESAVASFPDVVQGEHENAAAVGYVELRDIVQGYPDGTFKPDNKINRAEFTKIIIRSVFTEETIETCMRGNAAVFPDVPADAWFAKYVCTAKVYGVIQGYPDGTFKPGQNISFVEAAKILSVALRMQNGGVPGDVWYERYVRQIADKNAVPITVSRFGKELTRGEVAEIIWRVNVERHGKASLSYEDLASIEKDPVGFYAAKLKDPTFVALYGHGYTWYMASEELGAIGKDAVPALIGVLDTADEYERTRALEALMLAAQHPSVATFAKGEYPQREEATDDAAFVAAWKAWYEKHRSEWADEQTIVQVYFVNTENDDAGSSAIVGCGDTLKPVTRRVPRTQLVLRTALELLLGEKSERVEGLYNALAKSDLTLESVTVSSSGTAEIRLGGMLRLGGTCDEPRVRAQLEHTAKQFTNVKQVEIRLNGGPLIGSGSGL